MAVLSEFLSQKTLLAKYLQNPEAKKLFFDWLNIELAYTSNAIEGSTLTRQETALAIQEDLTSKSKPLSHYLAATNHAKAFAYVKEYAAKKKIINVDTILTIHDLILSGIDDDHAGCWRTVGVRLLGSKTILPNPAKVPALMAQFNAWLIAPHKNVIDLALEAHYRLVSIHPFVDGNGRTARLLMNLILLRAGFPPIIIRKIDRRRYLAALEDYQNKDDASTYRKFMYRRLASSFTMAFDLLDPHKPQGNAQDYLSIHQFAKLVGQRVSCIRYWVKIGKLKPALYTANGYMMFLPLQKNDLPKRPRLKNKK